MDDERTRLLQIASDVFNWTFEMVSLLNKVGEIGRRPDVPEAEKQRVKDLAERIGDLFIRVADLSESQPTTKDLVEQLIAGHDRLREELAKANALLDQIVKTKA